MAKKDTELSEDVFELLERIEKLKQPTIDQLLNERQEIDRKLQALGYHQRPVTAKKAGNKPASTKGRPPKPDGPGPANGEWKYCDEHGWGDHDSRRHRADNIKKKAAQAK